MAKSKKSKILAMALCASVMTGIYASPVMAAELSVTLDGQGIVAAGTNVTGTFTIAGDDIATALTDTNLTLNSVTANTISTSGTLTAAGLASLNGGLTVNGERLIANKGLTVSSDGITIEEGGNLSLVDGNVDVGGTGTLTVNGETTLKKTTVNGTLTAGATDVDSLTVNTDKFVVDADGNTTVGGTLTAGATTVDSLTVNGAAKVNSLEVTNGIKAAKGTFQLTDEGVLTVGGKATFTEGATVQNGLTVTGGASVAGNFAVTDGSLSVTNGGLTVNNGATILNGKLDVGTGNFKVDTAGNTEINGNLNINHGAFEVTAADGSFSAARDKFNVSADGVINADSLYLQTYGGGTLEVGEALQALTDAKLPDKVGGIERDPASAGDPGDGTTTIEGATSFDATGMSIKNTDGFGTSLGVDSMEITAAGGLSTRFTAGGATFVGAEGETIIEGGAITAKSLLLGTKDVGKTIAGIEGDPENEVTTIEGATSFTKDGMTTNGSLNVAGGRFIVDKETGNMSVNAADGKAVFQVNGNDGTVHVGKDGGAQTVITGNSITTETLNVENIKLGNSMTDKDGNTITIGAAGVIDIEKDGNTVFRADTDNFEAHYDNYDLTLDGTNGFALSNASNTSSFSLGNDGFAFAGPVHLGNGTLVEFSHNGTDISLSSLVDRVEDLEQKTTGISFDENTGSTTIKDMNKVDGEWKEGDSSVTVGDNGTTFENGEDNGTTNINGGAIYANSSLIGNDVSGGSGSASSGSASSGTYTDGSVHTGYFEDGDNSYEFTNDADGFTGTVTDGKHTTTIENGAMGSNTTVTDDGDTSASSGVGIGNDGAFISDSVTNGDMTVTEVKDKNGSATTVKDANGSSTVSQDTKGQTVSTGTGTSVNTGNDFGVTDNETGKSIYMSDIGHVEDIDSEIQNSDGSKTTVVDAVNNEAEIRRNEIERVDGRINNLENRVGKLEDRIDKVGAMSAAIANLRTMGYDPAAPTEIAVGVGQYRSETGVALGMFHYPNKDFMLSLSVSTSGDEVMGGIGATWKFGRKSPEKVLAAEKEKAAKAKLAKAEAMKQAAKEAKIKAQQERHAKLAAERAAQAEAAK